MSYVPRPTRHPWKCPKCGKIFYTRKVYVEHREKECGWDKV